MPREIEREKKDSKIPDEAINAILNTKFEAPGWPIWGFPDKPSEKLSHSSVSKKK